MQPQVQGPERRVKACCTSSKQGGRACDCAAPPAAAGWAPGRSIARKIPQLFASEKELLSGERRTRRRYLVGRSRSVQCPISKSRKQPREMRGTSRRNRGRIWLPGPGAHHVTGDTAVCRPVSVGWMRHRLSGLGLDAPR